MFDPRLLRTTGIVCFLAACSGKEVTPIVADSGADVLGDTATSETAPDSLPEGGPTIPPGAEDACRAYHEIMCSAWEKCNPVYFAPYVTDHATCVARGTKSCVGIFDDPGMAYGPDALKKCATSIAGLTCVQYFRVVSENATLVTPECGALRTGTLPAGASCGSNQQCASTYCEVVGDADCGKCTERAAKGASCFSTHPNSCEPGSECLGGKCVAFGEADAICDDVTPCHADLACVAGKCAARLADGAACDPYKYQCVVNHWCNSVTSQCEPYGTSKLGGKCGLTTGGGIAGCDATSRCNITNKTAYTGTCMALALDGAACTFVGQCEYPESCLSSVCKFRDNATLCK